MGKAPWRIIEDVIADRINEINASNRIEGRQKARKLPRLALREANKQSTRKAVQELNKFIDKHYRGLIGPVPEPPEDMRSCGTPNWQTFYQQKIKPYHKNAATALISSDMDSDPQFYVMLEPLMDDALILLSQDATDETESCGGGWEDNPTRGGGGGGGTEAEPSNPIEQLMRDLRDSLGEHLKAPGHPDLVGLPPERLDEVYSLLDGLLSRRPVPPAMRGGGVSEYFPLLQKMVDAAQGFREYMEVSYSTPHA